VSYAFARIGLADLKLDTPKECHGLLDRIHRELVTN